MLKKKKEDEKKRKKNRFWLQLWWASHSVLQKRSSRPLLRKRIFFFFSWQSSKMKFRIEMHGSNNPKQSHSAFNFRMEIIFAISYSTNSFQSWYSASFQRSENAKPYISATVRSWPFTRIISRTNSSSVRMKLNFMSRMHFLHSKVFNVVVVDKKRRKKELCAAFQNSGQCSSMVIDYSILFNSLGRKAEPFLKTSRISTTFPFHKSNIYGLMLWCS